MKPISRYDGGVTAYCRRKTRKICVEGAKNTEHTLVWKL